MRIYLDNAATSWPKPEAVYAAVDSYQRELGAPAARSGYADASEVTQAVARARLELSRLLGVGALSHVIFTANGTDALNLGIQGTLRAGDHVVTTVVEHNSVLRPLTELAGSRGITVSRVGCSGAGVVDPDDVRRAVTPRTRLIVVSHASNVTGALQPIAQIGQIARELGVLFLVDAAQTAGHVPLDMSQLEIDMLATPGHKGLLGPSGTGLLCLRPGMEHHLRSLRQGGTGTQSDQDRQPDTLPEKYEAGSLNVPGILGLGAAAKHLRELGLARVREHSLQLNARFLAGLSDFTGLRLYGPETADARVGLFSVGLEGYDPQELAAALDSAHRIQCRAGLHCAPLMHAALGTAAGGGTVRFSHGWFNTTDDVDRALAALAEIAAAVSL